MKKRSKQPLVGTVAMEEIANYLNSIRRDFAKKELDRSAISEDPFQQFATWLEEAVQSQILDPQSMVLCTADADGKPSSRVVYMRGLEPDGLLFYTNYNSKKGQDMAANDAVSLLFFWPEVERQIRMEGRVQQISTEASDAYFNARPRESKIGAWASQQSESIDSREALQAAYADYEKQFEGKEVQRPPHWGGYKVVIDFFEFWQGRPSRLHDRLSYEKMESGGWTIQRLNP